jgi:hypothetical protein
LKHPKGYEKDWTFINLISFGKVLIIRKKYRLTKWKIIRCPKDPGELGIEVLDIKNKYLLSKWLFKILNKDGMWQELLHNKFLKK